jgi:predicted transcriptional regulator
LITKKARDRLDQRITICLSKDADTRLTALAEAAQVSVGWVVRRAVLELLAKEEDQQ